jgi:hypothetical protein
MVGGLIVDSSWRVRQVLWTKTEEMSGRYTSQTIHMLGTPATPAACLLIAPVILVAVAA